MVKSDLKKYFFLAVGKINAFAIKDKDQHKISFLNRDKKEITIGQLKVYCPVVIPFIHFNKIELLNNIWPSVEKYLEKNIPFEKVFEECLKNKQKSKKILNYIERWNTFCLRSPSNLKKELWQANLLAYRRSIFLQKEYEKEDISFLQPYQRVGITLGRIKASFIAMAPHYNVEGLADDALRPFKYHLPNLIQEKISQLMSNMRIKKGIDLSKYLLSLRHHLMKEVPVDRFRFVPILPSLLKKFLKKRVEKYKNWDNFRKEVISKIKDSKLKKIIKQISKAMKIDKEVVVLSGVLMYEKILRKFGRKYLLNEKVAKKILSNFDREDKKLKKFFKKSDRIIRDNISKTKYRKLVKYCQHLNIIEIINGKLGYYKFVPLIKNDKNFEGKFFPYGIIKSQKKILYNLLKKYKFLWRKDGLWFSKELKKMLKLNPSLYTKWLVPFFEKNKILIKKIYPLIDKYCYNYLERLKRYEEKK